jgi:lipopolysaccharide/colanic/teichoic acid biosynthesis glycosyltransferase
MPGMTRPVSLRVLDEKQSVSYFELSLTPPVRSGWALMVKRICDVVFSTLGLLVLSPVFVILGILVKLQDGGPVFHRRRVISARGSFDAFKFRSMCPDADAVLHGDAAMQKMFERQFKLEHDPRITPLGALLRKYSLDELPQLFNVLRGQMSLVGPRMIAANELPKYGKYQKLLLSVKPGLTGYWQVHGRQNVEYSRRVEMDIYYIRNWSLRIDLRILLHTPKAVMKGSGAL